jgi:hypothetical protein
VPFGSPRRAVRCGGCLSGLCFGPRAFSLMLRMFGVVITVWSLVLLRGGLALAEEPKPAEASAADTRGRELLGPKLSTLPGAAI